MPALKCPHCNGVVAANPVGRWFNAFLCPHCKKPLAFDTKTNLLGVAGSLFFVAGVWTFMVEDLPNRTTILAVAAAGWIVLTGLSYALRGIEKK